MDICQKQQGDEIQKTAERERVLNDLIAQYQQSQGRGIQMSTTPTSLSSPYQSHGRLSYPVDSSGDVVMEDLCTGCKRAVPHNTLMAQQHEKITELSKQLQTVEEQWNRQVEVIKEEFRREFERKYYETRQNLHEREVQQKVLEQVAPWFVHAEQIIQQQQRQYQNSDGSFPRWR